MKPLLKGIAVLVAIVLVSVQVAQAKSLEQLRVEIERALAGEREVRVDRVERHRMTRDAAQQQLQLIKDRLSEERSLLESINREIEANTTAIAEQEQTLKQSVGELQGVFSAVRQAARDLGVRVQASLTSAALAQRRDWLDEFAADEEVPTLNSIERLWLLIQQEILESGRLDEMSGTIVSPDGRSVRVDRLHRIGAFSAVAGEKLLVWAPGLGAMRVVKRETQFDDMTALMPSLPLGLSLVTVDPTRGQLIALADSAPDPIERLGQGGAIGYVIVAIGVVGLCVGTYRAAYLYLIGRRVHRQRARVGRLRLDNPLGRVLSSLDNLQDESAETQLEVAVLRESHKLRSGENLVRLFAAIAPLLGLLGTVTGMILTFQTISALGTTDPKLMAGGISQALVTTALGLIVAIPLLLLHGYLRSRSRKILSLLEEQALGLLTVQERAPS